MAGDQLVRGRENKIATLQKSITDLELEILCLNNSAPTVTTSDNPGLSIARIIEHAIAGATDSMTGSMSPSMAKHVKREELEAINLSPDGLEGKDNFMQIDCEIPEVTMYGFQ